MKVGYLGSGAWGVALANVAAEKGHQVVMWSIDEEVITYFNKHHKHPRFPKIKISKNLSIISSFEDVVKGKDILVESVTTKGVRDVMKKLSEYGKCEVPLILTSKGIEQGTDMLVPEIAIDVMGEQIRDKLGYLSGPSLALEVMEKHPTSVVASAFQPNIMQEIQDLFGGKYFRVYNNTDVLGVAVGGALKNVIAVASGIAYGLNYGDNTRAALITRGLRELGRVAKVKGGQEETVMGLSGLGDLAVTCMSPLSRNFQFGKYLGEGYSIKKAREKVQMVVEGENTVISAKEIAKKYGIDLPITDAVYAVICEGVKAKDAVDSLLSREVKNELV